MTSKERIKRIFHGESVDRVGCFEQTLACSVASDILGRPAFTGGMALEYHEACAWWAGDEAHDAFINQVVDDTMEISTVLGFDMIRPRPGTLEARPTRRLDEFTFCFGSLKRGAGVVKRFDPGAETWAEVAGPGDPSECLAEVDSLESSLEELTDEAIDSSYAVLDAVVARQGKDKAILDQTGFIWIPPNEAWLTACVTEPAIVERYLDCVAEGAIRRLPFAKMHGADLIWAGGDLAGSRGPLYSPDVLRNLLLPRLRRITAKCRELDLPYVFRSDGNLWRVADDLLGASGIAGYGEIDIEAGMDIGELRARFPRLVLWGNVSCSSVLHRGSVQDVIRATQECIDKTRGVGHIVGSSNSCVRGTPTANILAMFETARQYRPA